MAGTILHKFYVIERPATKVLLYILNILNILYTRMCYFSTMMESVLAKITKHSCYCICWHDTRNIQ